MVQPPGTPKSVIIATAADDVSSRFAEALRAAGHRTIVVTTGQALLDHARRTRGATDLLLVDLSAAEAGTAVLRAFREVEPRVPVVVFSGSVETAGEVRALAALGIDSYVNEHSATPHILPSLSRELFPDSFNRRTSRRVILDIPVVYRHADTIATAPMLNLGKGGLGIRTLSPVDAGTKTRVTFRLPGSAHTLGASARVAWSDQRTGLGLQFEEMAPPHQTTLDEFVDRHVQGEDTH